MVVRTGKRIRNFLVSALVATVACTCAMPVFAQDGGGFKPEGNQYTDQIPKEPGWKAPSYRGWELVSIPGLISTYYDLDLDGELDYAVIRKIIKKMPSQKVTIKEAITIARVDHLAVYVSHPTLYFTKKYPLFYCRGLDFRKNCQNIWVDVGEDGLNGNETLYTLSVPNFPVR